MAILTTRTFQKIELNFFIIMNMYNDELASNFKIVSDSGDIIHVNKRILSDKSDHFRDYFAHQLDKTFGDDPTSYKVLDIGAVRPIIQHMYGITPAGKLSTDQISIMLDYCRMWNACLGLSITSIIDNNISTITDKCIDDVLEEYGDYANVICYHLLVAERLDLITHSLVDKIGTDITFATMPENKSGLYLTRLFQLCRVDVLKNVLTPDIIQWLAKSPLIDIPEVKELFTLKFINVLRTIIAQFEWELVIDGDYIYIYNNISTDVVEIELYSNEAWKYTVKNLLYNNIGFHYKYKKTHIPILSANKKEGTIIVPKHPETYDWTGINICVEYIKIWGD